MDKETMDTLRQLLREELEPIKTQLTENTQILKALEHKAEVNKSEHDKMQNDIAHIQGDLTHVKNDVEFIKKDLSRVEEATASNWVDIARLKAAK